MSKFALQAVNMVHGQLETNEVLNTDILQLLVDTPREDFVPSALRGTAYIDKDIEVSPGRYMLAPMTFAKLLELAEVTPSCRVLAIGDSNAYATAILSILGGHVVAIDSNVEMHAKALENAARFKLKDVDFQQVKNMADGYAVSAPYDVIFINGAVRILPDALTSQLGIGGRLVAIREVKKGLGKGILVRRLDGQVNIREYFDASTAVLEGFEESEQFVF